MLSNAAIRTAFPLSRRSTDCRYVSALRLTVLSAVVMMASASCSKSDRVAPAPKAETSKATTPSTAPAKPAPAVPEPVKKLLGKWVRSDGGYVLDLRSAELSGVVQAGYFNPKSINVSRAIWMQGPNGFQVVVELNDVGYPGATYILSHDATADKLVGQYNQPAMQQSFDIEFLRQPPQP